MSSPLQSTDHMYDPNDHDARAASGEALVCAECGDCDPADESFVMACEECNLPVCTDCDFEHAQAHDPEECSCALGRR